MRFPPLDRGRPFKRLRERSAADTRPSKKASPTPSVVGPEDDLERTAGCASKRGLATPAVSPARAGPDSADRLSIAVPLAVGQGASLLSRDFGHLSLFRRSSPTPRDRKSSGKAHQIFEVPEIVEIVLGHVAASDGVLAEKSCSRRRPLSYQHALLIYKDEEKAQRVWKESACGSHERLSERRGSLFSCLLVNKLWHSLTLRCLLENVLFRDHGRFAAFAASRERVLASSGTMALPSSLVLHKFHRLHQDEMDRLSVSIAPGNLKWIELYICPNVLPPLRWLPDLQRLKKLILPGNKVINDEYLFELSQHVPNLLELDLRACDNVTDSGVIAIALKCRRLRMCNLGRHRNGEKITSLSVASLAEHTQIETLGIAGCQVTDASIWILAQARGSHIRRLSLNNCSLLSDHSIPLLLAFNYFPNLSVLEVRNVDGITDVRSLVSFKLWKTSQRIPVLIEGCERITKLMSEEEARVALANSVTALKDMSHWVNT